MHSNMLKQTHSTLAEPYVVDPLPGRSSSYTGGLLVLPDGDLLQSDTDRHVIMRISWANAQVWPPAFAANSWQKKFLSM